MALGDSAQELAEGARAAEAAGAEGIWAIELYRSTFTQATWLAAQTETIGVGTGITWAFTRSPFLLAVSALDVDEMSGGRFRLGLGSGVKRLNERWHGSEYGRPAPHLRETVEAILAATEAGIEQIEANPRGLADGPPSSLRRAADLARAYGSQECGIR